VNPSISNTSSGGGGNGAPGGSPLPQLASGGSPQPLVKLSRKDQEAKAAWDLLMRSLRCFLKHKALQRDLQLPPSWSPVAWLVTYCAAIKRDWRSDGRLVATAAAGAAADAAAAAAAEAAAAPPGQAASGAVAAAAAAAVGGRGNQEEEPEWPVTGEGLLGGGGVWHRPWQLCK
jgi:hypothetical protein